jgi:hypothetical protein
MDGLNLSVYTFIISGMFAYLQRAYKNCSIYPSACNNFRMAERMLMEQDT